MNGDLYGTPAKDNQVKTLRARKTDKEGPSADKICNALFKITLRVRSRHRGEMQAHNSEKLVDTLVESHGEKLMKGGVITTADRRYR